MPTCPKCFEIFHRGAESHCPRCGFRVEYVEQLFGTDYVTARRVTDLSGALRQQEKEKLSRMLEKIERRVLPAVFCVYFPSMSVPFSLVQHSFWFLNHINIQPTDFGSRKEPVSPEWFLVLVLDVRSSSANFVWGYQLDPYINIDRINSSIVKARLLMREGLLVQGVAKIMKEAARHIASNVGKVAAQPEKHGIKAIQPPPAGKGGEE